MSDYLRQLEAGNPPFDRITFRDVRDIRVRGDLERLETAIAQSTSLKELWLDDDHLPCLVFLSFICGIAGNRSIEEVHINFEEDDERTIPRGHPYLYLPILSTTFFAQNRNLKKIIINDFHTVQFNSVLRVIRSCSTLTELDISLLFLDKRQITEIMKSLPRLQQLSTLRLNYLYQEDFSPVFESLGDPNFNLSSFFLDGVEDDNIQPHHLADLSHHLKTNKNLKELCCAFDNFTRVSEWDPFLGTLRLYNDTLTKVDYFKDTTPDEISSLLQMNQWEDKEAIRNRKALDYGHLKPKRKFRGNLFGEGFDVRLLPYVLSSIGTERSNRDHRSDGCRYLALFHFVMGDPLLVVNPRSRLEATSNNGDNANNGGVI